MVHYETLRHFAAVWGSLYFAALFVAAVGYALWPSNRKHFDEAALIPSKED
jgi:cytochrome c oxidase cbb3-type subunit 4